MTLSGNLVAETCDRVVVMYSGRLVEEAPVETLFAAPSHPYTRGLLSALPRLGAPYERGKLPSIPGQIPDPADRPDGCSFHPRCTEALEPCSIRVPELYTLETGHTSRCLLHEPDGVES